MFFDAISLKKLSMFSWPISEATMSDHSPFPHYNAAHWGIYTFDSEGATSTLKPFGDDPAPSALGVDQRDPAVMRLRICRPAVRKSWLQRGRRATGEGRGNEPFVEVPWDEAAGLVADELDHVRSTFGNEAVFGGSYGWASAGRFHHAQSQLHRFLNLAGGYVRSVDSYSLGAGRALMGDIVAPMDELIANATSWDVIAEHTQMFVTFGGVPAKNAQVAPGGAGRHRVSGGLRAAAAAGVRFINISPVRDNLDTGGPVEWIPIRPNTDTALILALIYQIDRNGRLNYAFLKRYCVGADEFLHYVRGSVDGRPKNPAWAQNITSVSAERIVQLSNEISSQMTMLNCAWALQRAAHGEQPFWAVVALAAVVGQIGLPGGGFGLGYGAMNTMGSNHPRLKGPTLDQGRNTVTRFIPVARISDMLLNPGESFTYRGETHFYPHTRLVWWAGGNPFHHHQDTNRLRRALRQPDTLIVQDQFWNPFAKFSDIVLPASTNLERNDIGFATREGYYVAMKRMAKPPDLALSDHEILTLIAQKMGFHEEFTQSCDEMTWLRSIYDESRNKALSRGVNLPDFDEFWDVGLVSLDAYNTSQIAFSEFRADPVRHPLPTPSGLIEITSATIASHALNDCPGYPVWIEPFEWLGDKQAERFPLHLISDQPATRLHSQLDNANVSLSSKIGGREPAHINPADAAARHIVDGDIIELFNDRGICIAGAVISDAVMPGVVRLSTGAWSDGEGNRDNHGNPNVLTADIGASSFSQGCAAQSCLIEIRRLDKEPPPLRAFQLPIFVDRITGVEIKL